MKLNKYILTIIACAAGMVATQAVSPVLTVGKKWTVEIENYKGELHNVTYKVVSDTVVEGLDCKIVENGGFRAVWYESDGKVYQQGRIYLDPDFDLMYDMAIEKGKYFNGSIDMYISSFTVAHLGKDVTVHKVSRSPGDDSRLDYWVEGVGPINGELIADPLPGNSMTPHGYRVVDCYDGDNLIFDRSMFDDEVKKILSISLIENDRPEDLTIYNLQGIPVTKPAAGQIYLRGGKKIVWTE